MSGSDSLTQALHHEREPIFSASNLPDLTPDSPSLIKPKEGGSGADTLKVENGSETSQVEIGTETTEEVVVGEEPVYDPDPVSVGIPLELAKRMFPKIPRRRNPEEMSKHPEWLPEDWKVDIKVRTSGSTMGMIDPYYIDPTGKHRFRSKKEVLDFLANGDKVKQKPASGSDAGPSGKPKSRKKRKFETQNPDQIE